MKESSFIEDLRNSSYKDEPMSKKCKLYLMFSPPREKRECKMFFKQMRSDFDPIFNIASVLGVSVSTDYEEGLPKETPSIFKKTYDILINLVAFFSLVTSLVFAHNYSDSRAMTLTYGVKCFAAYLIRCHMIMGKSKIPRVIKTLSKLYGDVTSSVYRSLKVKIYMQCLAFTFLNIALICLSIVRSLYESRIQDHDNLNVFGYNLTMGGNFNIVHLPVASYFLNCAFSVFTMTVSILSCCNVHLILQRLIKSYGDSLILSVKEAGTKESFTEDFVLFRKIIYAMNEADDALSFIVFFTYVACISCFFNTLSGFLEVKDLSQSPLMSTEIFCTFLFSVAIFFTITYSAAEVSTAGDRLKQRLMCVSDIALHKNLPNDALLSFMITIDNIKSSNMSMTGWGMFTITRGFVLTTVGVLITYGVLLFQFAQ